MTLMSKTQDVFLVCGVPGSGKTWVCEQLTDDFDYVPHDDYLVSAYGPALISRAKNSDKPVLGEAPFRISVLIQELRKAGIKCHPYFIIEPDYKAKSQYEARENKPMPKMHMTRMATVRQRARDFGTASGTSNQVLEMLNNITSK